MAIPIQYLLIEPSRMWYFFNTVNIGDVFRFSCFTSAITKLDKFTVFPSFINSKSKSMVKRSAFVL